MAMTHFKALLTVYSKDKKEVAKKSKLFSEVCWLAKHLLKTYRTKVEIKNNGMYLIRTAPVK